MPIEHIILLSLAMGLVAFLYSSVGHAGASGYIAVLTLAGWEPLVIKPTALMLNILVATIATWQFSRRGHFSWRHFWPFAVLAAPMAFLGGYLNLPAMVFKIIVGFVLLFSAFRFLIGTTEDSVRSLPPLKVALPVGAGLGLLSGLTGTGGGIFLTPLLLMMRWANTKTAAAVSALFILMNSSAGLLGSISSARNFPMSAIPLAGVVVFAGFAGSHFGSDRFSPTTIKRLLAVVLLIAGLKILWTSAD